MDSRAEKRSLRREMARRCAQVGAADRERAGRRVVDALIATPEFRAAPRLALFAARDDEISTRELHERAITTGKECLFPRCLPGGALDFAAVAAWDELAPRQYGLVEPPSGSPAALPGSGDLVLTPGLAFDRSGGRLGRGRGYYDRFFASLARPLPILFGLCFPFQLVDAVPVEAHDQPMAAVLTDQGLYRVAGQPSGAAKK